MLQGTTSDPLIAALRAIEARSGNDCWSFSQQTSRTGAHALLHYPAMMVPSLQGLILEAARTAAPNASKVLDPFAGSGTVLVEAMSQGLSFRGIDINPLAGLACLAKSGPYYVAAFDNKAAQIISCISRDNRAHKLRTFPGRDKWFSKEISRDLEKISFHIRREPSLWARRLFWLALSRVVRAVCNSRMSTYKLHARQKDDVQRPNAIEEFQRTVNKFCVHLREQRTLLSDKGLLSRGRYSRELQIHIGDVNDVLAKVGAKFDVVMTSPPYGDNATTIPYGQFSYLPLQWVELEDIEKADDTLISNTHATDTASLGGSLRNSGTKGEEIAGKYENAKRFSMRLRGNDNGQKRFAAFFADLDAAVASIAKVTANGGVHAWTISNRRICGHEAPMVSLLAEMLQANGVQVIGEIKRGIHFKKMANKNALSDTMSSETIVLARKGS